MAHSSLGGSAMQRIVLTVAVCAIGVAACSTGSTDHVASLSGNAGTSVAEPGAEEGHSAGEPTDEEAILAFSACMRDNGLDSFEDPEIAADGSIRFGFREFVTDGDVDRDIARQAMDECRVHLEGLALGRSDADRSEIEDQLVEFAACMRDEGFDMPDPDFSSQGDVQQEDGQPGGPFAGAVDPDDPDFQRAMAVCEDLFGGDVRLGPGPRGGGG